MKNPIKNQKKIMLRTLALILSCLTLFVEIVPTFQAIAMPILEIAPVVWGDANYDGVVDSSDASKVLETYSKNSTGQSTSYAGREDATLDGVVDSSDASAILAQYARISTGGYQKYIDSGGVFLVIPTGRTFTGIAVEEGITFQELKKLNPQIEDPEKLKGDKDKIYVIRRKSFFEGNTTTTITTTTAVPTTTITTTTAVPTTTITTTTAVPTTTTITTAVPTTIATTTTTVPTTMLITTATTTQSVSSTVESITGFEIGGTYCLVSPAERWLAYMDEELKISAKDFCIGECLYELKYTLTENVYKGIRDGEEIFIKVSPHNFGNWGKVVNNENPATITSMSITTTITTKSATTIATTTTTIPTTTITTTTAVPTTIATTTVPTTMLITTATTTQSVSSTVESITGFEIGGTYCLVSPAERWLAYMDEELKISAKDFCIGECLYELKYTLTENVYKGIRDGEEIFIKVSPHNFGNWGKVVNNENPATITSMSITTTITTKSTTTIATTTTTVPTPTNATTTTKSTTITTTKPVTSIRTEPVLEFVVGAKYMLSEAAISWNLFSTEDITKTPTNWLEKGTVITLENKVAEGVYKIKYNNIKYYINLNPENYFQWVKVIDGNNVTSITTKPATTKATTIVATKVTTTVTTTKVSINKVKKCLYNEPGEKGWKVRSTQDIYQTGNILDYLKNEEYYLIIETDSGWEKVRTLRGIEGWIYIADYPELFVDSSTTTTTTPSNPSAGTENSVVLAMPQSVRNVIESVKNQFPGCQISASVADITGKRVFSYNGNMSLFAGCSFKAGFCTYVFETCEQQNIDIDVTRLEYRDGMKNTGSGNLQYESYNTWWTIDYLENQCIQISDNTCYNVLRQKFTMAGFKAWLNRVGGQQTIWEPDVLYGSASSIERINEWVAIYRYITSGTDYANRLKHDLSVASPRFYDVGGPHKAGSSDNINYICASDCGIIYDWEGEPYIIAVIVQNGGNEFHSSQAVRKIANSIINWANSNNIF